MKLGQEHNPLMLLGGWVCLAGLGGIVGWLVATVGLIALPVGICVFGVLWELTQRKRKEILQQRIREQTIAEAIPAIVWSIGPDGVVDYANRHLQEFSGMAGMPDGTDVWLSEIHPEDRERIERLWKESCEDPKPFEVDLRVRRRSDGEFRWHHGKAVPVYSGVIRSSRWFCAAVDVHDLRHSEESFRLAAQVGEELADSLDLKTTLETVVRLAIPQFADWGYAYVIDNDGTTIESTALHINPTQIHIVENVLKYCLKGVNDPESYVSCLKRGEPLLIGSLTPELLKSVTLYPETVEALLALKTQTLLAVPIMIKGKMSGVLTFATSTSSQRIGKRHGQLLEDIACRASIAIENSWNYREATQSLALMNTLMNRAPVGFAFLDRDLRVRWTNESMAEYCQVPVAELIGKSYKDVIPEWAFKSINTYTQSALAGEPLIGLELSGPIDPETDKTCFHALSSFYPVTSRENKILGIGATVVEISEQKQAERDIAAAKEAAESANSAKDRFLAILSHELRTPLTPVLAAVDHLLEDRGSSLPVQRDTLLMIRRNIGLESRMINDLLDITMIGRGTIQLELEMIDVHELVRQAVDICRSEITASGHQLSVELNATTSVVHGDPLRLLQAIWNLIKNAVKFTPNYGIIRVATRNEDDKILFCVQDNGIGIAGELLPRIFDFFVQGSDRDALKRKGLGLGLAISKWVIDSHGGQIQAISEGPGKGAKFVLELQTVPVTERALENLPDEEARNYGVSRILILDSDEDTRNVLSTVLTRRGYKVETASLSSEARVLQRGQFFDLIISDTELDDGPALELMSWIRETHDTPFVMITADLSPDEEAAYHALGGVSFLLKPVDFSRIMNELTIARPR